MHRHSTLGAVGSGTLVMHCHIARGQWAVELLQCTATMLAGSVVHAILLGGSRQWNSCSAPPHCLASGQGAV